jgi:hypothetical protein
MPTAPPSPGPRFCSRESFLRTNLADNDVRLLLTGNRFNMNRHQRGCGSRSIDSVKTIRGAPVLLDTTCVRGFYRDDGKSTDQFSVIVDIECLACLVDGDKHWLLLSPGKRNFVIHTINGFHRSVSSATGGRGFGVQLATKRKRRKTQA